MGGAPEHPSWFANIVANPIVKVELGTDTFQARATVADRAERFAWRERPPAVIAGDGTAVGAHVVFTTHFTASGTAPTNGHR